MISLCPPHMPNDATDASHQCPGADQSTAFICVHRGVMLNNKHHRWMRSEMENWSEIPRFKVFLKKNPSPSKVQFYVFTFYCLSYNFLRKIFYLIF